MTLIAMTLNYNRPVVISDTLVSARGMTEPIQLPGVNFEDYKNWIKQKKYSSPKALKQKMYIVNGKICLVFAGDELEIKIFLPLFKEYFPEESIVTNERIHQFLKAYNLYNCFKESSFFILYVEKAPENKFQVTQFYLPGDTFIVDYNCPSTKDKDWNILEEPIYQQTWAHASGADRFLKLISQPILLTKSRFPEGDMMRAIQMNTLLIAKLHALQTIAKDYYSLIDDWGAAFEIAYFNGEKFEKLDKYAYLIYYSQFDDFGDIGTPWPMYVLYYQYIRGVLFITEISGTFELAQTETQIIFTSSFGKHSVRIFKVPSVEIDEKTKIPDVAKQSFSTDMMAVAYSLTTKHNTIFNPAFFNLGAEVKVVYKQGKNVKIFLDKSISEDIRNLAKQQYPYLMKQAETLQ